MPLSFHPLNFGHSSPTVLSHRVSQHFTMLQAKATTFVVIKCDQQCFNCFFCFVKKDRPLVTVCDNFVTICVPSFSTQLLLFSLIKKVSLVLTSFFFTYNVLKSFQDRKARARENVKTRLVVVIYFYSAICSLASKTRTSPACC